MKVLVIDDNKVDREVVKLALREIKELEVTTVETIADAMKEIAKEDFGLIITDMYLKHENGSDVLKALKVLKKEIPTVMFTSRLLKGVDTAGFIYAFEKTGNMNALRRRIVRAIRFLGK